MIENRQLLAEYVEKGSEEAFRELVRRYINLVYSTALRLVGGDRQLAEDAAQTVFMHLARNAARLPREVMLGGWLHRDTCHVASNLKRGERRRQAREKQVVFMESMPDHTQANLALVAPILDEAINVLSDEDRTAVLLRFFEQLDFRAVGAALGSTEDAARMRVARAVEKLHGILTNRGVALSATALAAGLTGEAVTAAPSGLAACVAAAALGATGALSGTAATTIKVITMTKIKAGILAGVIAGSAAIPIWVQHQNEAKAQEENRALREQVQKLAGDNERLSSQVAQALAASPSGAGEQERELLRLRSEVGNLRRQVAEASKAQAKNSNTPTQPPTETETAQLDQLKQAGIAKMNFTRRWLMALLLYAEKNQDRLPSRLEEAAPFLPGETQEEATNQTAVKYGLTTDQFELVYQGSIKSLKQPQNIIVIREKQPWDGWAGGQARGYAFADGHSEIHVAQDGNFEPWEAQHTAPPPETPPGQ
jgi:RNA polymerase sigma factor (sigma-70 family)